MFEAARGTGPEASSIMRVWSDYTRGKGAGTASPAGSRSMAVVRHFTSGQGSHDAGHKFLCRLCSVE
jgi:hypothetical protein